MLSSQDRASRASWAKRIFQDEVRTLRDTEGVKGCPNLLGHEVLEQTDEYEHPGGYLNIIAMSWMPGKPAPEYADLPYSETSYNMNEVIRIAQ